MNPVFTVGHSSHAIDDFVAMINSHDIGVIADIRSVPYSRYRPQFARPALVESLQRAGLSYVYLGEELGGVPSSRVQAQMQGSGYAAMAQTPAFLQAIARIARGRERYRIALMCAERDPLDCHRALLVGRSLAANGMPVEHVHADGSTESQMRLEGRLLEAAGSLAGGDLLSSPEELLDLAYLRQERRVGLADVEEMHS